MASGDGGSRCNGELVGRQKIGGSRDGSERRTISGGEGTPTLMKQTLGDGRISHTVGDNGKGQPNWEEKGGGYWSKENMGPRKKADMKEPQKNHIDPFVQRRQRKET